MSALVEANVLFKKVNLIQHVILNKPKALNALDLGMIRSLGTFMTNLKTEKQTLPEDIIRAVIISGTGGRAFCAGGDVKGIYSARNIDTKKKGRSITQDAFFREEYMLDIMLAEHTQKIPHISLWDGVVMGGGLGISHASSFRIATEKTVMAMPETAIGLIPDVGGSFFLPRLKLGTEFGAFLALTGTRLQGADVLHSGVATDFLPSSFLPKLISTLETELSQESLPHEAVRSILSHFFEKTKTSIPPLSFSKFDLDAIQYCFATNLRAEEIFSRCDTIKEGILSSASSTLRKMCPLSIKLTLEQLRRGQKLPMKDCYSMELRIVLRLLEENDFYEGVRAALIDKDGKPKWSKKRLEDIDDSLVSSFFAPLDDEKELIFGELGKPWKCCI